MSQHRLPRKRQIGKSVEYSRNVLFFYFVAVLFLFCLFCTSDRQAGGRADGRTDRQIDNYLVRPHEANKKYKWKANSEDVDTPQPGMLLGGRQEALNHLWWHIKKQFTTSNKCEKKVKIVWYDHKRDKDYLYICAKNILNLVWLLQQDDSWYSVPG